MPSLWHKDDDDALCLVTNVNSSLTFHVPQNVCALPFPQNLVIQVNGCHSCGGMTRHCVTGPLLLQVTSVGSGTDSGTESKCELVTFYSLDCLQFFNHIFDLYPKEWCCCLCPWTYALYFKKKVVVFLSACTHCNLISLQVSGRTWY